jgi:uncharacterized protein YjbI with pentapeptide repeats
MDTVSPPNVGGRGYRLAMTDFSGADLSGSRFDRADLSGARLWHHRLYAERDLAALEAVAG